MTNQLQQFRSEVYQNFNNYKRTDTLMDLVDAHSSNTTAKQEHKMPSSIPLPILYLAGAKTWEVPQHRTAC